MAQFRVCPDSGFFFDKSAESLMKANAVAAAVSLLIAGVSGARCHPDALAGSALAASGSVLPGADGAWYQCLAVLDYLLRDRDSVFRLVDAVAHTPGGATLGLGSVSH